ncbi:MAG TPA: ribokinase [Epulopiscium sp.]|nr:ribokinase [Candidatus Epulonipiscium sp.]
MKILNIGSLNYDHVYSVHHIVKPGETIASTNLALFPGGKGLNQSIALARAGAKVYHAGMVGSDGEDLLELCKQNNIDVSYIKTIEGQSGHTIIQVDESGQNCILLYGGSNRRLTKDYINEVLNEFEAGDWLLLQNEVSFLDYIIDQAHEKGLKIALNPSPFDQAVTKCDLSKVSLFLINEIEGNQITGKLKAKDILDSMMKDYKDCQIVLTLGAKGAIYRDQDKEYSHGIYDVNVVDTTAAGDTFTGYFIQSLLENATAKEGLELASKASAIAVSRAGAAASIPYMKEVLDANLIPKI